MDKLQIFVFLLAVLGLSLIGLCPTLTIIGFGLMMPFAITRIAMAIKTGKLIL